MNNYDKDVFNGDIGIITAIDQEAQEVAVDFEGRAASYDFSELDELELAYAISVHKSQGSEYPAVIMPVMTQHYMLLMTKPDLHRNNPGQETGGPGRHQKGACHSHPQQQAATEVHPPRKEIVLLLTRRGWGVTVTK